MSKKIIEIQKNFVGTSKTAFHEYIKKFWDFKKKREHVHIQLADSGEKISTY